MSIPFYLIFLFAFGCNSDSLQLPIKNGKIIQSKQGVDRLNKAVIIVPGDDICIRSCLDGKISIIDKDESGYTVCVKSDSITMIYSIFDSIDVKLNENIKRGDVIGLKNKTLNDYNYIMFSVFIFEKEVEAADYLVNSK
jgi:murein DD-endopeptidase MepM/ murein hydrolase activator NlpD